MLILTHHPSITALTATPVQHSAVWGPLTSLVIVRCLLPRCSCQTLSELQACTCAFYPGVPDKPCLNYPNRMEDKQKMRKKTVQRKRKLDITLSTESSHGSKRVKIKSKSDGYNYKILTAYNSHGLHLCFMSEHDDEVSTSTESPDTIRTGDDQSDRGMKSGSKKA
ncbi:unnamed protein product [Lymnaea stagnalis]|uniref:Uncharacterized protein n=1 Tax=Lymnaea stagnalis TaxID=6523 RepID=A0AAV2I3V9_LYMST